MCRRWNVGVSPQEKGIWNKWLAAVEREDIGAQTESVQSLQRCSRSLPVATARRCPEEIEYTARLSPDSSSCGIHWTGTRGSSLWTLGYGAVFPWLEQNA